MKFLKIDSNRLSYLSKNRKLLRAGKYSTLRDQLRDYGWGEDELGSVWTFCLFFLFSKHVGNNSYLREKLHDFTAISKVVGILDILLIVTCNLHPREIENALLEKEIQKNTIIL